VQRNYRTLQLSLKLIGLLNELDGVKKPEVAEKRINLWRFIGQSVLDQTLVASSSSGPDCASSELGEIIFRIVART
jgi:hypothetical protein